MSRLNMFKVFLVTTGLPALVLSGECCKAHYDFLLNFNDEKWCSDFCCFQYKKYVCCDNSVLQAPPGERKKICSAFFAENKWVVALLVIGSTALVVGLSVCVCIFKVCCGGSRSSGVIIPRHAAAGGTLAEPRSTRLTRFSDIQPKI